MNTFSDADDGVKLLAQHLAQYKLQAQEQIHELREANELLLVQQDQLKDRLRTQDALIAERDAELQQVRHELTTSDVKKWRMKERDDWKQLVSGLEKDRGRLKLRNAQLGRSLLRGALTSHRRPSLRPVHPRPRHHPL